MKRVLLLLVLVFAATLTFTSCGKEYKPVKSTDEESRVVCTMTIDGVEYEVKYELYRMLFLNNKSLVDGGDDSVWSSDKRDEYIGKINEIIYERAAEIFSVFALARELDINPYSVAVEDKIYEYIVLSVEGNQADVKGHGSYDKFLASLKEKNMNYSVMELLLRYSIVSSYVYEEYNGTTDEVLGKLPGDIEINREDILAYYLGDECVRVLQMVSGDYDKMVAHRAKMAEIGNDDVAVALYIINNSTAVHTDLIVDKKPSGIVIGKYALDYYKFGEYADAIFALESGKMSEVIEVGGEGYYIAYKLQKTEEHFDRCYDVIRQSYIDNAVGKQLEKTQKSLFDSLKIEKGYSSIDHADISMG